MVKRYIAQSLDDYLEPGKYIVELMNHYSVFLLEGELGAGKTTLVQKISLLLESEDIVSSPTFALINPYQTRKGMVYHMDMYRVNTPEEAVDFGVEEYIWDGHYCFIEWPEKIEPLLPDEFVRISIIQKQGLVRELTIETIKQDS